MSLLYSSFSQRGHTLAKHKSALQGAQVLEHFLHHLNSDLSEGFLHIALGYGGVFDFFAAGANRSDLVSPSHL